MSEPTQEQIEEARELFLQLEVPNKNHAYAVAKVIAFIRAKATNDALERAAKHFDSVCCGCLIPGHPGDGWMTPPDPPSCCQEPECAWDNGPEIATAIRAMKVPL